MIEVLGQWLRQPHWSGLKQALFLSRGIVFKGGRYVCPCCGWRVRSFVAKGAFVSTSTTGYCPRCNAKARHRRHCLYLEHQTDWLNVPLRLLDIGPCWAISRRFQRSQNVQYVGVDVERNGPQVSILGDVIKLPFAGDSFDAAICTHVLEHVPDDRSALGELYRVLKPGGAALVSVPIRLDRRTDEDISISDPDERARRFGERGHVRWYGNDFPDRLRAAGFMVSLDQASDVPDSVRAIYGLRQDENLFHCKKPSLLGVVSPRPGQSEVLRG